MEEFLNDSDVESVDSIDLIIEDKKKISPLHYFECKTTCNFLVDQHLQTFFDTVELDILKYYEKVYNYCKQNYSTTLRFDRRGIGSGKIVGLIYKYIEKEYNLEEIEEYPQLMEILIAYKKNKEK